MSLGDGGGGESHKDSVFPEGVLSSLTLEENDCLGRILTCQASGIPLQLACTCRHTQPRRTAHMHTHSSSHLHACVCGPCIYLLQNRTKHAALAKGTLTTYTRAHTTPSTGHACTHARTAVYVITRRVCTPTRAHTYATHVHMNAPDMYNTYPPPTHTHKSSTSLWGNQMICIFSTHLSTKDENK